jgi:hypothetical protein
MNYQNPPNAVPNPSPQITILHTIGISTDKVTRHKVLNNYPNPDQNIQG